MCEECIKMVKQVPPAMVTAFESFIKEAEELGAKAGKALQEAGYLTILPETFSDEQKAAGVHTRTLGLYGLAAIAGFTCNNAYHDPDIAVGSDDVYEAASHIGWAVGYVNETAVKN